MKIGDFDRFTLKNTIHPFGIRPNVENRLTVGIVLEPFKDCNTQTRGAILYLQTEPYARDETGLFPTRFRNAYYGDLYEKHPDGTKSKDLLLFQFIEQTKELIIDAFYGYYPRSRKELTQLIDGHNWHKKNAPESVSKVVQNFDGH
ncbi:hypothetical protein [Maribacter aurantiacus]|uniref:Uncharacterized protein n=1 Tax=Maribacter aurantiacus TaxID=1882343 RepID=A0A5R8MBL7_9FLAO|nr:hypothetical protein [Maribacter aurantiacus]TLF46926.1 hypothetical protein FEK29_03915 [Maribacter aurantiacus]